MSKLGAFTAAVLFAVATALAPATEALAKSGGGGHGGGRGGGHHGGGHGVHKGGGGKHGFHGGGHRGRHAVHGGGHRGRHAVHGGRRHGGAHAVHGGKRRLAVRGGGARHARGRAVAGRGHFGHRGPLRAAAGRGPFVTTGLAAHGPAWKKGFAAPLARSAVRGGLGARFYARPAFHAAVWPGPLFWPWAVDDVFWPTAYDDVFWTYGPADILAGALRPDVYQRHAYGPPRRGRPADRERARGGELLCRDRPVELADLAGIEQEVRPTAEQRAPLDELRAAEAKAVEILQTACPADIPPTPTGRLDAMARWFDAMRQAVHTARPALEKFYGALSEEQKARFLMAANRDAASRWLANCRSAPSGWASLRMDGIARQLRLERAQLAGVDDLSRASDLAADAARDSCPGEIPLTPTGRLGAIEARVAALVRAIDIVRPALDRFHASLSDEQKARFNAISARQTRR
jgi:hypothetical protein